MISMKQKAKIILNSQNATKTLVVKTIFDVDTNANANVNVCTNYNFKFDIPIQLKSNSRLAATDFIWNSSVVATGIEEVGGVYCKSITPYNVFNSEGYHKGCHLLSCVYSTDVLRYENNNLEMNSISLQNDNSSWINNGIDIFVDSKFLDATPLDIGGCFEEDNWSLVLIIYDVEEYDTLTTELSEKIKNYVLPK